jgi:hypothetical protein
MRFVKVKKYAELSGYTEAAIHHKLSNGVWMENREYRRAPDNVILIDTDGIERWVLGSSEPPNLVRARRRD